VTADVQDLGLIDAAKVEALAGFGLTAADIAQVLEVDLAVLEVACARELKSGGIKANARVAESLYRKALGDGREAVTAAIFWLKTRARWKETSVQEHTLGEDEPMKITVTIGGEPPPRPYEPGIPNFRSSSDT
jgi:hypothetical protein